MQHEETPADSSLHVSRFMFSRSAVLIFLAALLQFCLFLNHRDVTGAHEGRVVATAREMLADGDWLIPHCNGQLRLRKPPLPYWLTMIDWKLAGITDAWLARLP